MFHKCKATVIQRRANKEIAEAYAKHSETNAPCDRVADNQVFIISNPFEMPEGIYPWA